jgi:NADPH:quinone reductase-like Zn-dependent oxidoreductase
MAETMRAARLFEYGGPEVFELVEAPVPTVGPFDVLLKVLATSVNTFDVTFRLGFLDGSRLPGRRPFGLPAQLGREAAGEVAAVGDAVTRFAPGDRAVMAPVPACGDCFYCRRGKDNLCVNTEIPGLTADGGYAQYVVVAEHNLFPAPDDLTHDQLACGLWAYGTVLRMAHQAALALNDNVLVTGVSGSLGIAAVQIARAFGARTIIGTTGSPQKVRSIEGLGVDQVLNFRETDVPAEVKRLTGRGVDVVIDTVGGAMAPTALDCLALGGTLAVVTVGQCDTDLMKMFQRELRLVGARGATRVEQELAMDYLTRGVTKPVIGTALPLTMVSEAHRLQQSGEMFGRIVLLPWD